MNQQQNTADEYQGRTGWTGLLNSMIGFTNAATMFSIQQMQNAMSMFTDSRNMVNRFQSAIDSVSRAMTSEVDGSKRDIVDEMNRAGSRMVDATVQTTGGDGAPLPEETLSGRKR